MVSLDYMASWGERVDLVLCAERYQVGGGTALLALDACDPESDEYLELWDTLSVNIPDSPWASDWCSEPDNIILDTNNISRELVDALIKNDIISLSGGEVFSGFCSYPMATITPWALKELRGQEETVRLMTEPPEQATKPKIGQDGQHHYMLLSRLLEDCRFFLGHGNAYEGHLWAGSVESQVEKMREIYDSFADEAKPEWTSRAEIDGLEVKMLAARDGVSTTTTRVTESPSERADAARRVAARTSVDDKAAAQNRRKGLSA